MPDDDSRVRIELSSLRRHEVRNRESLTAERRICCSF